jgi:ferric-chelate reductase (NADPH)
MTTQSSIAPPGIVESALHRLVSRRVEVQDVTSISEHFRLVTLAGDDLLNRSWTPGDMFQVGFAGFEGRAYTPLAFDARTGTLSFLGYIHGNGVGSAWLAGTRLGEQRFIFGPRSALNLNTVRRPAIFFGDETSFSTAAALRATAAGLRDVTFIFEVTAAESARVVLARIGLGEAVTLLERDDAGTHLDDVERRLLRAVGAAPEAHVVLTGQAASVQRLNKALRRAGVMRRQLTNLAYWAPGRKGFSGAQR